MKGVCLQAADGGQRASCERFFAKGEEQRVRWDRGDINSTASHSTVDFGQVDIDTVQNIFSRLQLGSGWSNKTDFDIVIFGNINAFFKCVMARLHHELCFYW